MQDTANQNPESAESFDCAKIISLAQSGDTEAFSELFRRNRVRIYSLARRYFAPGWDRDDLIQEGTIGFFKAVRDYRDDRGSFSSFVDLCVRRQVITFIKTATRQKHAPLNNAISMDKPVFENSDETLLDRLSVGQPHGRDDLSDVVVFLTALWERCSELERGVLSMYSKGYSFEEMAWELGVHYKSIDNAVWRVKVKARKLLAEKEFSGLPIRSAS